jgi:hypothetical protein
VVVQDTPDLIALYMPAGVHGKDTERKPTPAEFLSPDKIRVGDVQWERTDVLFLIVPGESFSTYAMWKTGTKNLECWYANLQEPIRRTRIGFDTMDHMLDVVIDPDMGKWRWKDDDEFTRAQAAGFYSPQKAAEIRRAGEMAVRLITSDRRSFYEKWATWKANSEWGTPIFSPLWDQVDVNEVLPDSHHRA